MRDPAADPRDDTLEHLQPEGLIRFADTDAEQRAAVLTDRGALSSMQIVATGMRVARNSTEWPDSARPSPFGVPWSNRTSTGGSVDREQTLSRELEDGRHLLARDVDCSMTSSTLRSFRSRSRWRRADAFP